MVILTASIPTSSSTQNKQDRIEPKKEPSIWEVVKNRLSFIYTGGSAPSTPAKAIVVSNQKPILDEDIARIRDMDVSDGEKLRLLKELQNPSSEKSSAMPSTIAEKDSDHPKVIFKKKKLSKPPTRSVSPPQLLPRSDASSYLGGNQALIESLQPLYEKSLPPSEISSSDSNKPSLLISSVDGDSVSEISRATITSLSHKSRLSLSETSSDSSQPLTSPSTSDEEPFQVSFSPPRVSLSSLEPEEALSLALEEPSKEQAIALISGLEQLSSGEKLRFLKVIQEEYTPPNMRFPRSLASMKLKTL